MAPGWLQVDDGQSEYVVRKKKTVGKNKSFKSETDALVNGSRQAQYWRWSNLNPYNYILGGGLKANYNPSITPATPACRYPLYLVDLECLQNANGGTVYTPYVVYRLASTSNVNTSKLWFDTTTSLPQAASGSLSSSNTWQKENLPSSIAGASVTLPYRRVLQNWVDIKLLMYGTTKYVTTFDVELIKLKDDWLHPDWWSDASAVTDPINTLAVNQGNENLYNNRQAFWQMMLAQSIAHPLNSQDPLLKNQYRVVQRICSTTIQPKNTSEPNLLVPHMQRQDCFLKYNKMLRYDWDDVGYLSGGTTSVSGAFESNTGELKTVTRPKTRTYLMIRARAVVPATSTTDVYDPSTDPTFDLFIRKKITTLN